VTVLGGSISTGAVASRKQAATDPNDLWSLVRIYMQKNLDNSITFTNNARSATRSYITSLCLEKFLDDTSDLVFVEFIANDGSEMDVSYVDNQKARFFERFLRNIMKKPRAPAVVMMQVRSSWRVVTGWLMHWLARSWLAGRFVSWLDTWLRHPGWFVCLLAGGPAVVGAVHYECLGVHQHC
jgi:hypothetical protein